MAFLTTLPLDRIGLQAAGSDSSSDPFASISTFFESSTWGLITFLFKAFLVLFWLALVWWTFQDARRRSDNGGFIAFAVALSLLIPFLGTIIYLVIRPPEPLLDARERELELVALERRLGDIGDHEGQEIVGRMLGRSGGGEATKAALRDAGVASREELQDLEIRLTELEYRLRRAGNPMDNERGGVSSSRRPSASPDASRPSASAGSTPPAADEGDPRTTIRRMRRTVRHDPEASS